MTRERRTRLFRIVRSTLTFGFALLLVATPLVAQVTTGNIGGTVKANDGSLLPGVTITATSPVLQGSRVAYSGSNGDYILRGLPPGKYNVAFEMSGLASSAKSIGVELGQTAQLDVQLNPETKTEVITVVASAPSALTTTQLGANYRQDQITALPMPRTLSGIAALTPGINTNTPNVGQVRINGGFAYDNVFLVDGTDVNDNLFGTANNLYIEDAIAETQVMTGGVSAEYGRFTGGVINAITKSGGNQFTGTLRADFTKPNWLSLSPFEQSRTTSQRPNHTLGKVYQGTLGGPVLRDRVWFFVAGRDTKTSTSATMIETGEPFTQTVENPRYEGKFTGSILSNHTLQASYLTNNTTQGNNVPLPGRNIDPRVLVNRELPNSRYAAFYNGVITPSLFAELKYSSKKFQFKGAGGHLTDIKESPILSRTGASRHFNAPYFDATDPEDRNNNDFGATLSYFLSTRATGSHDFKGGYEFYRSTRTGGNSQSATSFVFNADPKRAGGVPVKDANGRLIPIWIPAPASGFSIITNWLPVRGAKVDLDTTAFFINDTWNLNKHFSFNLGYRYESVTGSATGDITTVDSTRGVPRLGGSFDIRGDGRMKIDATFAQYSGKYNERQFASNTNVGRPSALQYSYSGPAGEGIDFAPIYDPKNWTLIGGSFPTQNVFVEDGIKSPVVDEWTMSYGQAISSNGFFKATFTDRKWASFVEDFINTSTGFTAVTIAPGAVANLDNQLYGNTSDATKKYRGITLLGQYRPLSRWSTQINYTRELENEGNFVGEAANQPGNTSLVGNYPEIYDPRIHYPEGRLPGFQKDRVRWLNNFSVGLKQFGSMDVGLIYNYDSPTTFSFAQGAVPTTAAQKAALAAAGYKTPPTSQTIFFGELGSGTFRSQSSIDAALTYALPLFGSRISPWVKFQMTNLTNNNAQISWNTQVIGNAAGPKDPKFGLPTTFLKCGVDTPASTAGCSNITFGTPSGNGSYQVAREWLWSVGLRF